MRNQENEKLLMNFFSEMGPYVKDVVAAYEKYMHPDAVWKNSGFPDIKGIDAIRHLLMEQKKLFDFERVKVLEHRLLTSAGDYVFFERRDTIVNGSDEVIYAFDILGKFEIKDGKIVEWADYMDTSAFVADTNGTDWAFKDK